MASRSEENYLKAIYQLGQDGQSAVSTSSIADRMQTKASSVTDMLKKLADKKWVDYTPYQGVSLTDTGRLMAAGIVRKHRLWEVFLVEKLAFSWDEVHDIAEQLEHIKSEPLIDRIDAFLDHPEFDPHGDPIPDKEGKISRTNQMLLAQSHVGDVCICVGVKDSSSSFLRYLNKIGITLGTKFSVAHKEPFDDSMGISIGEAIVVISKEVTQNLYVKTYV